MIKKLVISLAVFVVASQADAAGARRVFRASIDETQLRGYVATPQSGWTPTIQYGVATPDTAANQQVYALAIQQNAAGATVPPTTPFGLSVFSLTSNSFVSKDTLPTGAQVTQAECAPTCPFVSAIISLSTALPGRIVVIVVKQNFTTFSASQRTYVFDPTAPAADRWFLAQSLSNVAPTTTLANYSFSPPDTKFYTFGRLNATTTNVSEVLNK